MLFIKWLSTLGMVCLMFWGCDGGGDAGTGGAGGVAGMGGGVGTGGMAGEGGTVGMGGADGSENGPLARTQACGNGMPCNEGATCTAYHLEWGVRCTCDPSGHFFCIPYVGGEFSDENAHCGEGCGNQEWMDTGGAGGAGGGAGDGAGQLTASCTNGFCTKTCVCGEECEWDCSGEGPASEEAPVCDPAYCDQEDLKGEHWFFGCEINDGNCQYEVLCEGSRTGPECGESETACDSVRVEGECPAL